MRLCSYCKVEKDESQFRGNGHQCSSCKRDTDRKYRQKHREKIKRYKRKYYIRNREECSIKRKEWKLNNQDKCAEYRSKWEDMNPEKRKANKALTNAIASGKIIKASNCGICGATENIEGHHHKGYGEEYVLDVMWLCSRCHHYEHKIMELNEQVERLKLDLADAEETIRVHRLELGIDVEGEKDD